MPRMRHLEMTNSKNAGMQPWPTALSGTGTDAKFSADDVLFVTGILALVLYASVALAALWMLVQHCRHRSNRRKQVFHGLLLLSVVLCLPDAVVWLVWPNTSHWIYVFPLRTYAVLLQSVCKALLSIFWSEVVLVGQCEQARRRANTTAKFFNCLLVGWGAALPILLLPYSDDNAGRLAFLRSSVSTLMTGVEIGIVVVFAGLLTNEGIKMRSRLLLVRGTLPAASVDKSLSQLLLTLCVILFSDTLHVVSLVLYQLHVNMSFPTFVAINNLAPTVFPTICMLYLMRRFQSSRNTKKSSQPRTLSRFMVENDDPTNPREGRTNSLSKYSAGRSNPDENGNDNVDVDVSSQRSVSPQYSWRRN